MCTCRVPPLTVTRVCDGRLALSLYDAYTHLEQPWACSSVTLVLHDLKCAQTNTLGLLSFECNRTRAMIDITGAVAYNEVHIGAVEMCTTVVK